MDSQEYKVIIDTQAQYSVWPDNVEPPLGWSEGEARGNLLACLDYIADVWKDRNADDEGKQFVVIADDDDILSIWLAGEESPAGWHSVTEPCSLGECLIHIKSVWQETGPLPVQLRSDTSSADEA